MKRFNWKLFIVFGSLFWAASTSPAQESVHFSILDGQSLKEAREAYRRHDAAILPAVKRLRHDADDALAQLPVSVTLKTQNPPSGDKHDYMSLARYYWPDTSKPGGLPYKSRDGEVNPEIYTIPDAANCGRIVAAIHTLALAYALVGDERYAQHSALLMRVWFLDTATRMNPNMTFAQGVKGMDNGRPAGTIETRDFGNVCDAAVLISNSRAWTSEDAKGLKEWFTEYLRWMRTHPQAIAASRMENNISVWFAVQEASVALFVGRQDIAREIVSEIAYRKIAAQIEPDGSQPLELRRTTSAHYVLFNLQAFFKLAAIAEHADIDLWNYQTTDHRSIRCALEWMLPYIRGEKEWTWKLIKKFDWNEYTPLLKQAASVYKDKSFDAAAAALNNGKISSDRSEILFYRR